MEFWDFANSARVLENLCGMISLTPAPTNLTFIVGLEIVAKDPFANSSNSTSPKTAMGDVRDLDQTKIISQSSYSNTTDETQPLSSQAAPSYKEKLYKETIELMTEGVFSLAQLCKVVSILSCFQIHKDPVVPSSNYHRLADKFWAGM